MEERNTEDKEFQNLLAIRSQLTALLIATSGGVIWLAQTPFVNINWVFLLIGAFFILRTVVSLHAANEKIDKIIKRREHGNT